jgi:hypothetical protein
VQHVARGDRIDSVAVRTQSTTHHHRSKENKADHRRLIIVDESPKSLMASFSCSFWEGFFFFSLGATHYLQLQYTASCRDARS